MPERTALVLSAGMMFGAYQAGVWKALTSVLHPDVVIGVSSGALNAWVIAGRCSPENLAALWLDPKFGAIARLRFPFPPWSGIFDSRRLATLSHRLHAAFRPSIDVAVGLTDLRSLRPRLFRDKEITGRHLMASCSIPFGFRPVSIAGRLFVDGGLLGAMPLWAAAEVGATRAVAINALPNVPSAVVRGFVRATRLVAPSVPTVAAGLDVQMIAPSQPMGSLRDAVFWRRENIERWIQLGENDGRAALPRLSGIGIRSE